MNIHQPMIGQTRGFGTASVEIFNGIEWIRLINHLELVEFQIPVLGIQERIETLLEASTLKLVELNAQYRNSFNQLFFTGKAHPLLKNYSALFVSDFIRDPLDVLRSLIDFEVEKNPTLLKWAKLDDEVICNWVGIDTKLITMQLRQNLREYRFGLFLTEEFPMELYVLYHAIKEEREVNRELQSGRYNIADKRDELNRSICRYNKLVLAAGGRYNV